VTPGLAIDDAAPAVGRGAIVLQPGFGELERMYVSPRVRGQGLAKRLLEPCRATSPSFAA
jgi:putative acetyltransferase